MASTRDREQVSALIEAMRGDPFTEILSRTLPLQTYIVYQETPRARAPRGRVPDPLNILHLIRELGTEFGLGNVLENGTVVPPAPKIVKILKKMKERQKELLKVLQHLWDESDFVEELQSKISRMVADEQKRDSEHAQIRARITEMTRRQEESTRLRREVEELRKESDANVEKFKLTMLRLHQNHAARIFNSTIRTYTTPIQALNSIDNVPIATFPRTISEVQALNGDQLDALLEALDLNKDGELEARRQRFAIFIGLSADFVYHCCDCLDSLMCRS